MWRELERELVDIFQKEDVELSNEAGDTCVVQGDLILFSITELAKELMRRGIGQGTPR